MDKKAEIYARVSSAGDRQDTSRQVADLEKYAAASGLNVVNIFEEKASGAKDDREVLADCIAALRAGEANTLLLSELSRLGRSVRKILDVTEDLTKVGGTPIYKFHPSVQLNLTRLPINIVDFG